MEGSDSFLAKLGPALEKRAKWLETTQIPALHEALSSYQALFEGAAAMLIRKGLLREDPYNYDQAFTEITLPSDAPLPDFESSDELSYRLAGFRRQLKYVSGEMAFDLQHLTLPRLKKLVALISYVNWLEFGESSRSPTTRGFARAFMKVRMSSDTMASQILKDAETQIVKTTHAIRGMTADLIAFHRESWKADLRRKVLPQVPLATAEGKIHSEEALRLIRKGFGQAMGGRPWYPALAEEVLEEELSEEGPPRKEKILASLVVAEPEKVQATQPVDGKTVLMEAVRILCRPHEELATALAILEENEKLLLDAHAAGGGWLRRLLGNRGSAQAATHSYKVQFTEPGAATPKTEVVDFTKFQADVRKKSTLFAALASGTGPAYRKLSATAEGQLAAFLDRQLNELLLIHRRLASLNTLFQARAAEEKKVARGIKIELLTLRNSIVKANQRRHEFKENGKE